MKILFLSRWFPYPRDNGSKIRIYNLIKGIAQRHDVSLLAFSEETGFQSHIPHLLEFCRKVEVFPWKEYNPIRAKAVLGFFDPRPRSIVDTFSPHMQKAIIHELAGGDKYDLVIASQINMAAYHKDFRDIPGLFEEVELASYYDRFVNAKSGLSNLRNSLSWFKTISYISKLLKSFKACTVVSDKENTILSKILSSDTPSIHIFPNCLDFREYQARMCQPEPNTLIFTGSFTYAVNFNAVCFFLSQIYPLIKAQIPEVQIKITGKSSGKTLPPGLLDASVHVTGFVADLKPLIANSWVSVVPILEGGGTRLKIIEALALGTSVVTTSKGAEGLAVQHNEHLLIADTPQEFAACTIRLLKQPDLRSRLTRNGRKLVQEKYNWQSVLPGFLDLIEHLPNQV